MENNKSLLLAFYGDDFTGSTDALEFLSKAGAKTVLFLENPTPELLSKFDGLDAIGIAGMTRAMPPEEMKNTLKNSFKALKRLNPRHVHYKVCSTFDSSKAIGNIGTAIKVGQDIFKNNYTPILVAAPNLGRYSAFGNLFARMGIGSQGAIYRLDQHPSMQKHPTTPSKESDLRQHLSKQIDADMGLIDLVDLEMSVLDLVNKIHSEIDTGKHIIFFDAMYEYQMKHIGQVIDETIQKDRPLFSVGSSGIEKALGDFWIEKKKLNTRTHWKRLEESKPLLVLSGSVSPVTASQIEWAVNNGFKEIPIQIEALVGDETSKDLIEAYQKQIVQYLKEGQSVIVHTSKGPEDPRIAATKRFFKSQGYDSNRMRSQTAIQFGRILGQSAKKALNQIAIKRIVIAGGDTSSYVARELGIVAVQMIAPIYTGAPLCIAHAPNSPIDKMEVNLKGGQVGDASYFGALQKGKQHI